jgi:hypothetical protein
MGYYGKRWDSMVRNGIVWKELGKYGKRWDIMVRDGIVW